MLKNAQVENGLGVGGGVGDNYSGNWKVYRAVIHCHHQEPLNYHQLKVSMCPSNSCWQIFILTEIILISIFSCNSFKMAAPLFRTCSFTVDLLLVWALIEHTRYIIFITMSANTLHHYTTFFWLCHFSLCINKYESK